MRLQAYALPALSLLTVSDVVDDDDVLEVTVAPPVAEVQLRLQVVNGPDPAVVGWWYDTVMDAGP